MLIMFNILQRFKIDNSIYIVLGGLVLDFFGSVLGVAWMYKETVLYSYLNSFISVFVVLFVLIFVNLFVHIISEKVSRNRPYKFFFIAFFLFQIIMVVGVFLPLSLILIGVWE